MLRVVRGRLGEFGDTVRFGFLGRVLGTREINSRRVALGGRFARGETENAGARRHDMRISAASNATWMGRGALPSRSQASRRGPEVKCTN